jgi:hypothetical protein
MMSADERKLLLEIHGWVSEMRQPVSDHHTTLYDAQSGLIYRVREIEQIQRDCPARESFQTGVRSSRIANMIAAGSLVVAVVSLGVAFWAIMS